MSAYSVNYSIGMHESTRPQKYNVRLRTLGVGLALRKARMLATPFTVSLGVINSASGASSWHASSFFCSCLRLNHDCATSMLNVVPDEIDSISE